MGSHTIDIWRYNWIGMAFSSFEELAEWFPKCPTFLKSDYGARRTVHLKFGDLSQKSLTKTEDPCHQDLEKMAKKLHGISWSLQSSFSELPGPISMIFGPKFRVFLELFVFGVQNPKIHVSIVKNQSPHSIGTIRNEGNLVLWSDLEVLGSYQLVLYTKDDNLLYVIVLGA